ncbi:MAG: exo-alpha-sialidase [Verrucomicrobia bacterium]|nr:exo-alpha-sialidase [Verrucomicrobiota bacterium]
MKTTVGFLVLMLTVAPFCVAAEPTPVIPKPRAQQVLVASAAEKGMTYLAFPSLLRTSPDEVLIAFKRGFRHGGDTEAVGEMLRFDTARNAIVNRQVVAQDPGYIHQMGEWVKFPNGDIAVYFDVQNIGHDGKNYRTGMRENRSSDGGRTFNGLKVSPRLGEREYGYPFDFIVQGKTTYMLVMAFGYRPGGRWSVDVIKSEDNGRNWSFVRNLTEEFGGHPINESAFLPWGGGFMVTTRANGTSQRLYRTDRDFRKLAETDLSKANVFMESHIGRPRLFARDGGVYLVGRNTRTTQPHGRRMELALFKIDPATLQVTRWVILDNAERANVTDGYYAMPYFQERGGKTWLNLINYRGVAGAHPDIVRLEYDWDEVR